MTSSSDARRIFAAQGLRAFVYGFGTVLLGSTLEDRQLPGWQVGLVLGSVLAGMALMSVAVARYSDRLGRRRSYALLYVLLAVCGAVFASVSSVWVLALIALSGAMSTDVVESGPFTSLEQSMISTGLHGRRQVRGFGTYNAVAAVAGSVGALAAGLPQLVKDEWSDAPDPVRWFWLFVPVALIGAVVALSLGPEVEAPPAADPRRPAKLGESRSTVTKLAGLFSVDSFGGGLVISAFIAFWLTQRFHVTPAQIGVLFFAIGLLQTVSFLVAPRLAERFGLLQTMVFTHLPSNVLLASVAFAPTFGVAVVLLLARTALSQMDVPTRQAYVMALVAPTERTPAAAYTNTARYLTRPLGPPVAGALVPLAIGLPFVVAGTVKSVYDVTLWRWFSTVTLPEAPRTLQS